MVRGKGEAEQKKLLSSNKKGTQVQPLCFCNDIPFADFLIPSEASVSLSLLVCVCMFIIYIERTILETDLPEALSCCGC